MCGYVAIINKNNKSSSFENFEKYLSHRGPDYVGQYRDPDSFVDITFFRLSILDLSRGQQPIINADRSVVMAFNGEIYNYKDLQREILEKGRTLNSTGDAETIIHMYELYGIEFVHKLEGMFSIFIWDRKRKIAYVIRDRFGIKPIYYAQTQDHFIFSSEIKPILCFPQVSRSISKLGLTHYLSFGHTLAPETLFQDVKKLPQSQFLSYSFIDQKINQQSYYDLNAFDFDFNHNISQSLGPSKEEILSAFDDSIKLHLQADVKVGAFLSGGIDSGLMVARASQYMQGLSTYTIKFRENPIDESRVAEEIARKFGTNHQTYELSYKDLLNPLPKILWHCDDILADSGTLPNYFISRIAKEDGCKVVLTGAGGDELFAGYNYYLPANIERKFQKIRKIVNVLSTVSSKNLSYKLRRSISYDSDPVFHYLGHTKVFHDLGHFSEDLYSSNEKGNWLLKFRGDPLAARLYTDMNTYIPENLMTLLDRTTMAWSLEGRVPFLHHPFVQKAFRLTPEKRVPMGQAKGFLKGIAKDILPESVFKQPKIGFNSPVASWMGQDLGKQVELTLKSSSFKKRPFWNERKIKNINLSKLNFHQKWTLFQLELFYRIHVDNYSKPVGQMTLQDMI